MGKHGQVQPGMMFGSLLVIERHSAYGAKVGGIQWRTMCAECGTESIKRGSHMVSGRVRTCGCGMFGPGKGKSGLSPIESTKNIFTSMLARTKPGNKDESHYAKKGVDVCERWKGRGGFDRFIEDIGIRPHPSLSLDRINNDDDYRPGNVRWTTLRVQALNTDRSLPGSRERADALHRILLVELAHDLEPGSLSIKELL